MWILRLEAQKKGSRLSTLVVLKFKHFPWLTKTGSTWWYSDEVGRQFVYLLTIPICVVGCCVFVSEASTSKAVRQHQFRRRPKDCLTEWCHSVDLSYQVGKWKKGTTWCPDSDTKTARKKSNCKDPSRAEGGGQPSKSKGQCLTTGRPCKSICFLIHCHRFSNSARPNISKVKEGFHADNPGAAEVVQ